ncbi:helix-turn-helix transcriptional regulator [Pannonibacter tanglangensis]|uniref:ArsR family transcriptional regulator n=1 Tax=Pannonibacter tanglangensis TaxID=2750084 RepID=A0ABW9ZJX4_9HYPH|nr:metalloregulator ArsR/SmtB family transcription factor [Pannonibacter sp. XCT-34]NBN63332.1 ArsR family transcriptional regulator [Pannonibacter sp. XCT-34]
MSDRTRTRLLNALKAAGPQTAADLAASLSVTPVAVRQHLDGLLAEDLVAFEDQKGAVGRPRRVWALTASGHARFPDNHSTLVAGLLGGLRQLYGEEGLERLIGLREQETENAYRQALAEEPDLAARLDRLAALRNREGYMAEIEGNAADGWLFIENHCSICAAATACQGFCRSELALFRKVLGPEAEVERTEHLLSGDRRCVYRIRRSG